jgi:hypothetical protein
MILIMGNILITGKNLQKHNSLNLFISFEYYKPCHPISLFTIPTRFIDDIHGRKQCNHLAKQYICMSLSSLSHGTSDVLKDDACDVVVHPTNAEYVIH